MNENYAQSSSYLSVITNFILSICALQRNNDYLSTAKGYITVEVLRQILHEIDDKISPGDLNLMIEEIDADGSGTVDFEGIIMNEIKFSKLLIFFLL